ncbi:MAG: glycosyltransferase [Candidatus Omnitrophica bacterium]|nr:glycosyltransferase [Candidatus Omnitrophota bacterium]
MEIATRTAESSELSRRLEKTITKLEDTQESVVAQKDEIAALSQRLKAGLNDGFIKDEALLKKEKHITELVLKCDVLQQENNRFRQEAAEVKSALEERVKEFNVSQAEVAARVAHVTEISQQLQTVLTELDTTKASLAAHKEEVETLSQKLKLSLDEGLKNEAEAMRLNEEVELLTRGYAISTEEIATLKFALEERVKELNASQAEVAQFSQDLIKTLTELDTTKASLAAHKEEVETLSQKLRLSLAQGLEKDAEVNRLTEELEGASRRLSLSEKDVAALKVALEEKIHELHTSQAEVAARTDEGRIQDTEINRLMEQLDILHQEAGAYQEEISNLSQRLQTSLDEGLHKEQVLAQQQEQFVQEKKTYKTEVVTLSNRLQESLGVRLELEKELWGVYHSEGFRFILRPLWQSIWLLRIILRLAKSIVKNSLLATIMLAVIPFIVLLLFAFCVERLVELFFGGLGRRFVAKREVVPFEELSVSVVIPNWNGIELLRKCLSSLYEVDEIKQGIYEVLVVDDASRYRIADCIKEDFPLVRVIRNRRNRGFGRTCNRGVREAKGELIILLNNDIMVTKDFFIPLKGHFRDQKVFAVAPKLYSWDKTTFNYGMHMGRFENGCIGLWNESETGNGEQVFETAPTIFAVGGAMCVRKRDFLWLGGFDDIFRPNCYEDIDISYRAQKRGLKVLYEPKSLVFHKAGATLNYHRHKEIKNELLFMWKNLTDEDMLLQTINHLPRFLLRGKHSSPVTFLRGFLWALDNIIPTLVNRFKERKYIGVSDSVVLNRCMLYYRNLKRNGFAHAQKKTILLVTPFILWPLNAGGKLRMYNLYKRLSAQYRVILLSLIHNEKEAEYAKHLEGVFEEVYSIHTKTPSGDLFFPKRYQYSYSSFLIQKLIDLQQKKAIDIVHIESNELLYLSRFIKHAPIVYTEHDISILSYKNSYYHKSLSDLVTGLVDYLKIVCHHSTLYNDLSRVIVLSREDEKVVRAFAPFRNYSLIPTGVDLDHFFFIDKTGGKKTLVFVGHYPHYPNEEAAVYFCRNVLPLIRNDMPEVKIKLVGSSPTKEVLDLAQIEGVEVVGEVEDVCPYLQDASVFVIASHHSAGIKGKVVEAMAVGTPVVSTSRGAYGINAVHNENIILADQPQEFAKSVLQLLKDEGLYRRIARNARKLVEDQYDWDSIARKLSRVYRDEMGEDALQETFSPTPENPPHEEVVDEEASHAEESSMIQETQVMRPVKNNEIPVINPGVKEVIVSVDAIVEQSLHYLGKKPVASQESMPEELHIELTHACNSRCITCDIWDFPQRNKKSAADELTLEELRKIFRESKSLPQVKTVVLSGGEPFLRQDFVEICVAVKESLPQATLGILSNLVNTEMVLAKTKEIIERTKSDALWIGSSLDGLGEAYDKMRGTPAGFSGFLKTIERFKEELPQIGVSTTFVLTPFNYDQLLPCGEFARAHGLDFFAQFGVVKVARSAQVFEWKEEQYAKIEADITMIIEKMITESESIEDFKKSLAKPRDKINLLTKIYYWSHLVDFQKTKKRFLYRCDAAHKFVMGDPYGNLFFCPLLKEKTIGNLRQESLDSLWSSQKAEEVRSFIAAEMCSCWLVCTVFPIVSEALALYGDTVASAAHKDTQDARFSEEAENRIIVVERPSFVQASLLSGVNRNTNLGNLDLNKEEFRQHKTILQSTPEGVTLGANYKCNAHCLFCLGGDYQPFSLKLYKNYFETRLGEMLYNSSHVSLCGMGELLLVPDIQNFLDYINKTLPDKNKIITTNGLALKGPLSDRVTESKYSIQISLHASNPALHEQLTGVKGGFDRIINQVRHIVQRRKNQQSPYLTLVFVVNTMNIEDLPQFVELAASLGADGVQCNYLTIFQPAHLKLSCFFKQQITNEIFDKAAARASELNITLRLPPKFGQKEYFASLCADPWKNIYVDTEGAVLPCCYSGEHFGELNQDGIFTIWNSDKFQQLRNDLQSGNPVAMCKFCLNSNPANVNFINAHVSFRPEVQKMILN